MNTPHALLLALSLATLLPGCASDTSDPVASEGEGGGSSLSTDTTASTTGGQGTSDPGGVPSPASSLTLEGAEFRDGGTLPAEATCDGAGLSPALRWRGAPEGTVEYALVMSTQAKDGKKWNWVLFGIPDDTVALAKASSGVGTAGLTSDGPELAYAAPCSQGPGAKSYTFTLYALSGSPTLPAQAREVTGPVLESAVAPLTLSTTSLTVTYTRSSTP